MQSLISPQTFSVYTFGSALCATLRIILLAVRSSDSAIIVLGAQAEG